MTFFILNDKTPVSTDFETWSHWFSTARKQRCVEYTEINEYQVSTVFMGISPIDSCADNLFETAIFNSTGDIIFRTRPSTWEEAEEEHKKAVQWVKDGCKDE